MVDPNFPVNGNPDLVPMTPQSGDLEQRLGLYRVFLKVYEHHRELLDEILDLENTDRSRVRNVWQYVAAVVQGDQIYLNTNLLDGKSQTLLQPQHCWIIGRDRRAGLSIQDKRLSRRHAMIQYVQQQGFWLTDLNSTNGTYINGEAVRRPTLLHEGDRVRLGSLSFIFFLNSSIRTLAPLPSDLGQQHLQIATSTSPATHASTDPESSAASEIWVEVEEPLPEQDKETFMFPKPPIASEERVSGGATADLSNNQKADILDRFLNR
ncbi:MAG: FHA domain-containing protein [Leptolyngbyaceae cyanobacterium bins.349]|nr:FHA domain-containing protein [Leptolyngbyaceae cyanobacterium bins.349]